MIRTYMPAKLPSAPYICASCLARSRIATFPVPRTRHSPWARSFANSPSQRRDKENDSEVLNRKDEETKDGNGQKTPEEEEGAMTRRLRDMSESALESGGKSSQKTISEAGFSEDLRKQLEERIASANFRAENASAFKEAELPSHVGQGTRDIALGEAWMGQESIHDATLRMLNDAHKPLKFGRGRMPGPSAQLPRSIDTGKQPSGKAKGTRLANARDRSGMYSSLKESDMDAEEREKRFQELKDRFGQHGRPIAPGTISAIASLANERIEDAIARGQFKNLPRGKVIERDYNASNPFLDTTEYFMNKMIQKQDIVPPWIEKQQELVRTATKFRSRLRNDWTRHAARMISSEGGTLQEQMRKAEAYAKAEMIANPQKKKEEVLNTIDDDGHISQISLSGELKVPSESSDAPVTEEVVAEKTTPTETSSTPEQTYSTQTLEVPLPTNTASSAVQSAPHPFRDPAWETIETPYWTVAITDLNSKTRSYNLQAPDLAKKPYFSLKRELNACYADVAPLLAEAIKQRAAAPKKTEGFGSNLGGSDVGVLDRLVGEKVKVSDERVERRYGLRQFWKDVFGERKG